MLFTAGQPQSECPAHTWAMAPLPRAPWAEVVEPWMGWLGTLDEAFTCFLFFFFKMSIGFCRLPQWLSGKESACNAGDAASIPASGRSPGGGHGNHSSILAWRIPWTEELGGRQSTASQRVRHDRSAWAGTHAGLCLILSHFFTNLFIYFWLCWVFIAARALSSCHVGSTP